MPHKCRVLLEAGLPVSSSESSECMCTEKASGNSLRKRKMHPILLKRLCGRRKHAAPIPQQAAPALSCCRTAVASASRRAAHVPSSLHSLPASAWTTNSGNPDLWCNTPRSVHPWPLRVNHTTPTRTAAVCLKTIFCLQ